MLKEKENKLKIRRSQLLIVGFFLIFVSILLIVYIVTSNKITLNKEEKLLNNFYQDQIQDEEEVITNDIVEESDNEITEMKYDPNYIAVLKIPKMNLERGLYSKDSKNNNVNKNILVLKESDYPDVENGNFILASHNGTSKVAFFTKLKKLKLNDEATVIYNSKTYKYRVTKIYDVDKTGKVAINRDPNKTTLTLITCKSKTKQLVVICELESVINEI